MNSVKSSPSARAQIITRRTYCRPTDETDTNFETWEQVINRVITHQTTLWLNAKGSELTAAELAELEELRVLLLERKVAPAGRTLWLGGTDIANRVAISQFNCVATNIQRVHDVVDLFWALLNGAGPGFRPVPGTLTGFRNYIGSLEIIPSTRGKDNKGVETNTETWDPITKVWKIVIGDSAVAWAKSVGKLIAGKYPADKLILDFSEIRGPGKRLRNYGWISQGDVGLRGAYEKIYHILNNRADRLLSAIDILDICNILGTVLSTRRAAEIAIMDYGTAEYEQFVNAKANIFSDDGSVTGLEHRSQSNNSLLFRTKPSKEIISDVIYAMHRGGRGEPGIINGETLKMRAPWAELLNPCVPGNTMILTNRGHVPIIDTIGKPTVIWNGNEWSEVTPFSTGRKMTYAVELSDGSTLTCTGNHKFVLVDGYTGNTFRKEVTDLCVGDTLAKFSMPVVHEGITHETDAYSQGFYSGDDNTGLQHSWLYASRYMCAHRLVGLVSDEHVGVERKTWKHGPMLPKGFVPVGGTSEYCLNWLAGLLDSDGAVTHDKNGGGFQITSTDNTFLQDVKLMLTRLGVQAKIVRGYLAGNYNMPDGCGGYTTEHCCKRTSRLLINSMDTHHLGKIGLHTERFEWNKSAPQRDDHLFTHVVSITPLDYEDVYCFNEPLNHTGTFNGVVTGQCAEILLSATGGACNLATIDIGKFKNNTPGLHRAAELIARANYRQSCVSFNDGVLQESWDLNNAHLHLCGISMMGIVKRPDMTEYDYTLLRRTVTVAAYRMADELKLPYPKNITTVKPEGCLVGNSLIPLNCGLVTLDEIVTAGDKGFNKPTTELITPDNEPVTALYNNGPAQTMKISFGYGLTETCTPVHKWWVVRRDSVNGKPMHSFTPQWVMTKDLLPEQDYVEMREGVFAVDNIINLPQVEPPVTCKTPITCPDKLSPDVAWLLGYMWHNQLSAESNTFTIHGRNYAVMRKVSKILKDEFNIATTSYELPNKGYGVKFTSSHLHTWLQTLAFHSSFSIKRIPALIRTSREHIIAFVAGIFDANSYQHKVSKNIYKCMYATSWDEWSSHFQKVCWAVGIGVDKSNNVGGRKTRPDQEHHKFMLTSYATYMTEYAYSLLLKYSVHANELNLPYTGQNRYNIVNKVKAVEYSGINKTYDLTVDGSHSYFATIFHTHNTISKCYDTTEGMHKPLGKYIFNNVAFSIHDPVVDSLKAAGYRVFNHPYDSSAKLVTLPVRYDDVEFDIVDGKEVNLESAIAQLERYKMLMQFWCDQNVSCTISYSADELPDIIDWLDVNWDNYVAVSFLKRNDPTKTARDLGYPYLPQEVVDKETYDEYVSKLKPVTLETSTVEYEVESDCAGGVCPIR